jgi:RNA polymerase sigma-70 factor (ECF subfamily)
VGAAVTTPSRRREPLAGAARNGDQAAFERLVELHWRELHVHCYRMLGSLDDADDALQDTMLRAWRAMPRFDGRAPRAWLYKIATNVCIDLAARRPKRVLSLDAGSGAQAVPGGGELAVLDPYPADNFLGPESTYAAPDARYEQREAIELAFAAALQQLPGQQRAVLILRDVLGYSAAEVSELLSTSVVAVNSTLQRARRTIEKRAPDRSQQAVLRSLGDARLRDLVQVFVEAWDRGQVGTLVSVLTDDLIFSMPPDAPRRGNAAVEGFLPAQAGRWRLLPATANGQLAFGAYRWEPAEESHRAALLDVVTIRGGVIAEIVGFRSPQLFSRFGLPASLPSTGSSGRDQRDTSEARHDSDLLTFADPLA